MSGRALGRQLGIAVTGPVRYVLESLRLRRRFPGAVTWFQLARQFAPWMLSLLPGASALRWRVPWMTFGAVDVLRSRLRPGMTVFEYGAGGSTLFLASRVARVVTVEHDPRWASAVREELSREGRSNVELIVVAPEVVTSVTTADPSDPGAYVSADPRYRGSTFREYACAIDRFPDGALDLVVVDGRARPACLAHALSKVGEGGMIILDNSDREHYTRRLDPATAGFLAEHHPGPCPFTPEFIRTTIYRRG